MENDESMSVVEDEVFDEDDYDRMEEDALAAEADSEISIVYQKEVLVKLCQINQEGKRG